MDEKTYERKFITLDKEVTIAYIEQGEGETILFLHGWICSGELFEKQIEDLSKNYRVIAMDFRGHGKSTKPFFGHTCSIYAQDLKNFLEKLNLENVNLVGWSLGAGVIFEYIKQFGNIHLKSLCIIDHSPYPFNTSLWNLRAMKGAMDIQILAEILRSLQEDPKKAIETAYLDLFQKKEVDNTISHFIEYALDIPPVMAGSILFDLVTRDRRDAVMKIKIPALIIFSNNSRFGRDTAQWLKSKIPRSRLIFLQKCQNIPFFENPEDFNADLRKFLEDLIIFYATWNV